MRPSIRPIAAQYAVTAATKAKTAAKTTGRVLEQASRAIPAAIHRVTQTVLTTAPGNTSSQMSEGSSTACRANLQRSLRLFPPNADRAFDRLQEREGHEEEREQQARLKRGTTRESLRDLTRDAGQLSEQGRAGHE